MVFALGLGRRLALCLVFAAGALSSESQRRLYDSSFTADAGNPVVSSSSATSLPDQDALLAPPGMEGAAPMGLTAGSGNEAAIAGLSNTAEKIISGFVEGFLHKQHLQHGELDCLVQGTGSLAGDVTTVSSHTFLLLEQIFGGKVTKIKTSRNNPFLHPHGQQQESQDGGDSFGSDFGDGAGGISSRVHDMMSQKSATGAVDDGDAPAPVMPVSQTPPPTTPSPETKNAKNSLDFFYNHGSRRLFSEAAAKAMSSSTVMMQLGLSLEQIVSLSHDIVKECIHGDALQAMKTSAAHLKDLDYVSGHIMANGADIVHELADAVQAFEEGNPRKFGGDLGRVARKVLLSAESNDKLLPEGMPGKLALANMSTGLINGFFGPGFILDIELDHGQLPPIKVDLHQCLADNLAFFQNIWASTIYFFAKTSALHSHERKEAFQSNKGVVQFGTSLAITMMKFPQALKRCHIAQQEEEELADSIKAMGSGGGPGLHFETPEGKPPSNKQATEQMARTVEDWTEEKWYEFGMDLGKLLQDFVLLVFSEKYTVDHTGSLRRQLLGLSQGTSKAVETAQGANPAILVFAMILLLAALIALKSRKIIAVWYRERSLDQHHDMVPREGTDNSTRPMLDTEAVE